MAVQPCRLDHCLHYLKQFITHLIASMISLYSCDEIVIFRVEDYDGDSGIVVEYLLASLLSVSFYLSLIPGRESSAQQLLCGDWSG